MVGYPSRLPSFTVISYEHPRTRAAEHWPGRWPAEPHNPLRRAGAGQGRAFVGASLACATRAATDMAATRRGCVHASFPFLQKPSSYKYCGICSKHNVRSLQARAVCTAESVASVARLLSSWSRRVRPSLHMCMCARVRARSGCPASASAAGSILRGYRMRGMGFIWLNRLYRRRVWQRLCGLP